MTEQAILLGLLATAAIAMVYYLNRWNSERRAKMTPKEQNREDSAPKDPLDW